MLSHSLGIHNTKQQTSHDKTWWFHYADNLASQQQTFYSDKLKYHRYVSLY